MTSPDSKHPYNPNPLYIKRTSYLHLEIPGLLFDIIRLVTENFIRYRVCGLILIKRNVSSSLDRLHRFNS